jgi:hypothetical protein
MSNGSCRANLLFKWVVLGLTKRVVSGLTLNGLTSQTTRVKRVVSTRFDSPTTYDFLLRLQPYPKILKSINLHINLSIYFFNFSNSLEFLVKS